MIGKVFGRCRNAQPGGVFLERSEEILKPAVFIAVGVGARPNAEFFHVIAHRCHAARMQRRGVAQVGDDLFDFPKRNKIAESFLAWEKPDALGAVFGDVSAKEFLGLKAGCKKMNVVNESIADAGAC